MRGRNRSRQQQEKRISPHKTVYIVCEGSKTEPGYFTFMKREKWGRRASKMVKIDKPGDVGGTDPDSLLNRAMEIQRHGGDFSEVWCVFDVEAPGTFPNLRNTLEKARKKEIGIALSNPAFEYWLLLHFAETTSPFPNGAEATAALKKHWPEYSKSITADGFRKIAEGCENAVKRARLVRKNAQPSPHPTDPMPRPSTDVDRLVTRIEEMLEPPYRSK